MSDIAFSISLATRSFISPDGGPADSPALTLGDKLLASVDIYEESSTGNNLIHPNVRAIRASVGQKLAVPTSGTFTLKMILEDAEVEPTETTALTLTSTADEVKAAINAVPEAADRQVQEVRKIADGVWLLKIDFEGDAGLEVGHNQLSPTSFVRVRAFESSGTWWHELRLAVAPLAFSGSFERILAEAPSITRIRSGSSGPEGSGLNMNEIQAVKIPRDFEGTFYLTHEFRATRVLGVQDGPDTMASALNALYSDGKTRFLVTNPEPEQAYVEFTGPLGFSEQDLLAVSIHTFAPGQLHFYLDLNREEMHAALRTVEEIEVPLEIELEILDDDADPEDPETVVRYVSASMLVTVRREVAWEELRTVPAINWLKPPQPTRYVPFHADQVITGNQHYVTAFGDGVASEYLIQHNLGTQALHVSVRQNSSGGRVLTQGAEYQVEYAQDDEDDPEAPGNAIKLIFPGVVGNNALAVVITTAGPKSAFQDHGHSIEEIDGLEERLLGLEGRVTVIEDRLPFTTPSAGLAGGGSMKLQIATVFDNFPGKFGEPANSPKQLFPLRAQALLPAVHDATVDDLPDTLPSLADAKGKVYKNAGDADRTVPGGLGHKPAVISKDEFATCDGRLWYKVAPQKDTKSYYPVTFEREFMLEPINDKMMVPGTVLTVTWKLGLQLGKMNTRAQYLLVADVGNPTAVTEPSPIGINLKDIEWSATPILQQKIILSEQLVTGEFGVSIKRDILNVITANRLLYKRWEEANAGAPTSGNFVLRIRLIQFDTQDPVSDPRGVVFVAFTDPDGTIA